MTGVLGCPEPNLLRTGLRQRKMEGQQEILALPAGPMHRAVQRHQETDGREERNVERREIADPELRMNYT